MILAKNTNQLYQQIYFEDTEPYIFSGKPDPIKTYYDFLYQAANLLEVSPHNVMFAGSSRLGFSLNPSDKKGRFLKDYTENSDIDLVVVSPQLFSFFTREFTKANYVIGHLKKKDQLAKKILKGFFDFYHFTNMNQEFLNWQKKTSPFQRELQKRFDISNEINYRIFNDWLSVELYYTDGIKISKEKLQKES